MRSAPTFGSKSARESAGSKPRFLRIVAARIGIQPGAPLRRHADEMRALVQHRMQRRVEARIDLRADQAGLALAPVGAGDDLLGGHQCKSRP